MQHPDNEYGTVEAHLIVNGRKNNRKHTGDMCPQR